MNNAKLKHLGKLLVTCFSVIALKMCSLTWQTTWNSSI